MFVLVGSTTNMHKAIVDGLVRAKILFFDSNPIGRILTRFSKDMAVMDLILPQITGMATLTVFRTITVTATLIIIYPYILVIVLIALIIMFTILKKAIVAQRECLRMDSIYRGPIHSTFAMIVNGLVTLRTFERVKYFENTFIDDLEKSSNVTFSYFAINRWMATALDLICMMFSTGASVFAVLAKNRMDTELLAFTLQILTDVIVFFSFSIRMSAEIENYLSIIADKD